MATGFAYRTCEREREREAVREREGWKFAACVDLLADELRVKFDCAANFPWIRPGLIKQSKITVASSFGIERNERRWIEISHVERSLSIFRQFQFNHPLFFLSEHGFLLHSPFFLPFFLFFFRRSRAKYFKGTLKRSSIEMILFLHSWKKANSRWKKGDCLVFNISRKIKIYFWIYRMLRNWRYNGYRVVLREDVSRKCGIEFVCISAWHRCRHKWNNVNVYRGGFLKFTKKSSRVVPTILFCSFNTSYATIRDRSRIFYL